MPHRLSQTTKPHPRPHVDVPRPGVEMRRDCPWWLDVIGIVSAWAVMACMALTVPAMVYVASGWQGVASLSAACGLIGVVGLAMAGER